MTTRPFNGATPIAEILAYVDTIRKRPSLCEALIGMLAEQSPIYAGRSAPEAERLRGYVLASFETIGLPAAALPFISEELESGRNPNTIAAAARALRGYHNMPDGALEGTLTLLLQAVDRIAPADDVVDLDTHSGSHAAHPPTTAATELFRTLAAFGPRAATARDALTAMLETRTAEFSAQLCAEIRKTLAALSHNIREASPVGASCCCDEAETVPVDTPDVIPVHIAAKGSLERLELEDQDGGRTTFGRFFHGRPSLLTFFYTRCMNPEKCSLSITKLGRLQRQIGELGLDSQINVAAITYDPAYDLPQRLKAYGLDRGMVFDAHNRLLRTTGAFEPLQRHFALGVGFGPVTVNRHSIDLVILDEAGDVATTFTRMLWSESDALAAVQEHLTSPAGASHAPHVIPHR